MTAAIIRGDVRQLPLPAGSVDLIVTSPPYFNLRDYRDGDASLAGQIGAEETPAEYVDALLDCTREWMRVLKPTGSIFVNLSDKYNSAAGGPMGRTSSLGAAKGEGSRQAAVRYAEGLASSRGTTASEFPSKTLLGLPWRYALGCIDRLGLILRRDQIWHKPSPLPESAGDRCSTSHEYLFHLVKQPHYYSSVDAIREPHNAPRRVPGANSMAGRNINLVRTGTGDYEPPNPLGKLPGSVWTIASQPLIVPEHIAHAHCCGGREDGCKRGLAHHAAFPPALVRRIVAGWSPPGICTACGEGRRPVCERELTNNRRGRQDNILDRRDRPDRGIDTQTLGWERIARITGYACACPTPDAPTRLSVVVDPFGGTGTVAMVADVLGRCGISVDLSHAYGRLAQWRTTDPRERARALGVTPPPPVAPTQGGLFDLEAS